MERVDAEERMEDVSSDPKTTTSSKVGGLRTMPFIIANESFEKIASYGLLPNMILYLMGGYGMEVAKGSSTLSLWSALTNSTPVLGAFLSDSYFGRFSLIAFGSICTFLGVVVLWLTAMIPQAKPARGDSPSLGQLLLLYGAFGLISIGAGGIRPCSIAFGADQLKRRDRPNFERVLQSYFNWYYVSIGVSTMLALTVIVYAQDHLGWKIGFGIPAVLMFVSALSFFLGSSLYVKVKADKSLFIGLGQVMVVAFKNRALGYPSHGRYHCSKDSKIVSPSKRLRYYYYCYYCCCCCCSSLLLSNKNGRRRTQCTRLPLYAGYGKGRCRQVLPLILLERLLPSLEPEIYCFLGEALVTAPRFLNKACIIRDPVKDLKHDGSASNPWSLCTVDQVEGFKALVRILPIWSTGIIIYMTISNDTLALLQAKTMDRHITSNFEIPAGSFSVFIIISLTIWIALYDRVVVPILSKYTGRPRGISNKLRMGIGLVLCIVSMVVAAFVENARRTRAIREGLVDKPRAVLDMSAMVLAPQYCLAGLAEAFNAVGQIEFYYSQLPRNMSSIAMALLSLGNAFSGLLASLVINILDSVTKGDGNDSWVASNPNKGRYSYYYWFMVILNVANLLYFLICCWVYGPEDEKTNGVSDEQELVECDGDESSTKKELPSTSQD